MINWAIIMVIITRIITQVLQMMKAGGEGQLHQPENYTGVCIVSAMARTNIADTEKLSNWPGERK